MSAPRYLLFFFISGSSPDSFLYEIEWGWRSQQDFIISATDVSVDEKKNKFQVSCHHVARFSGQWLPLEKACRILPRRKIMSLDETKFFITFNESTLYFLKTTWLGFCNHQGRHTWCFARNDECCFYKGNREPQRELGAKGTDFSLRDKKEKKVIQQERRNWS